MPKRAEWAIEGNANTIAGVLNAGMVEASMRPDMKVF